MKNEVSSFLKIVIKYNDIGTKALFAEATWNDDKKFVPKPIELKYYKFRNITILLKNTGSTFTWKIVAVKRVQPYCEARTTEKNYLQFQQSIRLVWQRSGYKPALILK